jgi:hypothetical protein
MSSMTQVDRDKFKNWLTKVVMMRAAAKGTKPSEEANQMRLELLNRRLKREGLLKEETKEDQEDQVTTSEN